MPSFKPPRHGVTLSEALHEAASIAPASTVIVHAFELWHPTLAEPIYVVNNFEDLTATKEAEADRDPGEEVLFMRSNVAIERPDESDSAEAPELVLTIGNVSGVMSQALRAARGSPEPWEVVERLYDLTDTAAPAMTPMRLLVSSFEVTAQAIRLRCSFGDPANVAVPRTTFRRDEYPGLVR